MRRLAEIAGLDKRLIVGLMSGTSADGIDAALIEIDGSYLDTRVKLLAFDTFPYPEGIADAVRSLGLHHPRSSADRYITVRHRIVIERADNRALTAEQFLQQALNR